jgi:hypothetical protein
MNTLDKDDILWVRDENVDVEGDSELSPESSS